MKTAIYTIITVAVILGAVSGVMVPVEKYSAPKVQVEEKQLVYVDLEELSALHPGSEAEMSMSELSFTIDTPKVRVSGLDNFQTKWDGAVCNTSTTSSSDRAVLRNQVAKDAENELRRLADKQKSALEANLLMKEGELIISAEKEKKALEMELMKDCAEKLKRLAKETSIGQVNSRLRVAALECAKKHFYIKHYCCEELTEKLAKACEEANELEKARKGASDKIVQTAKRNLAEMQNTSDEYVATYIARKRSEKTSELVACLEDCRKSLLADLGSGGIYDPSDVSGTLVASADAPLTKSSIDFSSLFAGPNIHEDAKSIDSDVREDMIAAVRSLADEMDMVVVFNQRGKSLPDKTDLFKDIIATRGLSAAGKSTADIGS